MPSAMPPEDAPEIGMYVRASVRPSMTITSFANAA
jgi:hypothetical protein